MSKVSIPIKNGRLTDEDFADEAPALGSSDKRYSAAALKGFKAISDRVARDKDAAVYNEDGNRELVIKSEDGEEFVVEGKYIPDA